MNQNELLKSSESIQSSAEDAITDNPALTKAEAEHVYTTRQDSLEQIRPLICLKFYHEISEKLERERRQFDRLLHIEDKKQDVLSRYTFVLNPYFFEQKFIS